MTYTGHMENGVVVFDGPAPPDGTVVRVVPETNGIAPPAAADIPSIYDRLKPVIGAVDDPTLPTDGAVNHDHYLYGAPKQQP